MSEWQPMETAPKDGTMILVCHDTGCGEEHFLVWWVDDGDGYPWRESYNSHVADRFDAWMPLLPLPSDRRTGDLGE